MKIQYTLLNKSMQVVSNQGIECLDKIGNLMCANVYVSEDVMQHYIAIIAVNTEAFNT